MSGLRTGAGLLLAMLLTGCGGGDTIPLLPAATPCDGPPDPRWQLLSPLAGDRRQQDGVWAPDGTLCVVGQRGMALVGAGEGRFLDENTGTDADLQAVAAMDDGRLLAVGDAGVIVERSAGTWRRVDSPVTSDLAGLVTRDSEAWAVGEAGTVLWRSGDRQWSSLPFPADADLRGVAVRGDSLAVCGEDGQLWLGDGQQWIPVVDSPWEQENLASIFWLDDGRLAVQGARFHVREPEGWTRVTGLDDYLWGQTCRARYRDGRVWILTGYYVVIGRPEDAGWQWDAHYRPYPQSAALGEEGDALVVGSRSLLWFRGGAPAQYDPDGLGDFRLQKLADGTVAVHDAGGLLGVRDTGLVRVAGFPGDLAGRSSPFLQLAGHSLTHYFLADHDHLWQVRDGQAALLVEWPDGVEITGLAVDADGRLLLTAWGDRRGVYLWDGTQLVRQLDLSAESNNPNRLIRTGEGSLVAAHRLTAWIQSGATWLPVEGFNAIAAGENLAGDLILLGEGAAPGYAVWRRGVGLVATGYRDPAPGCAGLRFLGGVDSGQGMYFYSDFPALVFRLEGDPAGGRWEQAAGPLENTIEDLEVLADGRLLAACKNPSVLMLYRPAF